MPRYFTAPPGMHLSEQAYDERERPEPMELPHDPENRPDDCVGDLLRGRATGPAAAERFGNAAERV